MSQGKLASLHGHVYFAFVATIPRNPSNEHAPLLDHYPATDVSLPTADGDLCNKTTTSWSARKVYLQVKQPRVYIGTQIQYFGPLQTVFQRLSNIQGPLKQLLGDNINVLCEWRQLEVQGVFLSLLTSVQLWKNYSNISLCLESNTETLLRGLHPDITAVSCHNNTSKIKTKRITNVHTYML